MTTLRVGDHRGPALTTGRMYREWDGIVEISAPSLDGTIVPGIIQPNTRGRITPKMVKNEIARLAAFDVNNPGKLWVPPCRYDRPALPGASVKELLEQARG